jgi:hypothetical protein
MQSNLPSSRCDAESDIVICSSEDERVKYNAAREARRRAKKSRRSLLKRQAVIELSSGSGIGSTSSGSGSDAAAARFPSLSGLVSTSAAARPNIERSLGENDSSLELPPPLNFCHSFDSPIERLNGLHGSPPKAMVTKEAGKQPSRLTTAAWVLQERSSSDCPRPESRSLALEADPLDETDLDLPPPLSSGATLGNNDTPPRKSSTDDDVQAKVVESARGAFAKGMSKFRYNNPTLSRKLSSSKSSSDSLSSIVNLSVNKRPTAAPSSATSGSRSKPSGGSLPAAYLPVLDICPVCDTAWTTRKTSAVKENHILKCANERSFPLDLVRTLIEDIIRAKRATIMAAAASANSTTIFSEAVRRKGVEVCVVGVEGEEGGGGADPDEVRKELKSRREKPKKPTLPAALAKAIKELERTGGSGGGVTEKVPQGGKLGPVPRRVVEDLERQAASAIGQMGGTGLTQRQRVDSDGVSDDDRGTASDPDGPGSLAMPPPTQPFAPSRLTARRAADDVSADLAQPQQPTEDSDDDSEPSLSPPRPPPKSALAAAQEARAAKPSLWSLASGSASTEAVARRSVVRLSVFNSG